RSPLVYANDPLRSELSLPSTPITSTKVLRRRTGSGRKRASSVSPAKSANGCQWRQARADRKAALLEEQALLLSARKQRLEQGRRRGGTLFSFSLHLPDLSSLLDDDGYISFPDLSEMRFVPECAQNFLPIKSPSLIPCFLFIFFFLLSTSFSVPYALTLSFPLALCLCYLEPKAASLTASIAQGYHDHDSSEEEETDSERTDFACDGEMTATESEADEDSEMRTQVYRGHCVTPAECLEIRRNERNPLSVIVFPTPLLWFACCCCCWLTQTVVIQPHPRVRFNGFKVVFVSMIYSYTAEAKAPIVSKQELKLNHRLKRLITVYVTIPLPFSVCAV
ncbi:hypothetical protein XENOCAPTIV_016890, partial [Xenoophorus captivus]